MDRRVKIICTIGPAVDSEAGIESLIRAGMDVARLNFSHGKHEEHAQRFKMIRDVAARLDKPVAILQDLCGPKIRCGAFQGDTKLAKLGDRVNLFSGSESSYPDIAIQLEGFAPALRSGDQILLDDGRIGLRVLESNERSAACIVETEGMLRDRVGVHLPARSFVGDALTEKDRSDLAFGLKMGVDFVAVSFVRFASDMHAVRKLCEAQGRSVPLVAKVETPAAIDDIDEVVKASDAVMVARGDLGVEFSPEAVPVLQRKIIAVSHRYRRPVIVATEMLQSMVEAPRPTRAEASDIANAVFGDADAVMLSAETATGAHPALAVEMMSRIVVEAERSTVDDHSRPGTGIRASIEESLAFNAADIADEIHAKALVAYTYSGMTALLASQARPDVPLFAFSTSDEVCRRTALYWGVRARQVDVLKDQEEMVDHASAYLLKSGVLNPGDYFVVVFGSPVGPQSSTNSIRVRAAG